MPSLMYVPVMGEVLEAQLAELRRLVTKHARRRMETDIDGVLLSLVEAPGEPAVSSSGTVLALILQGEKRLALGERVWNYGAGEYLVASIDLPVTGHFTRASHDTPALGFGLTLKPALVASLLLEAEAGDAAAPARPGARGGTPAALGVGTATTDLLDAVLRMVRLLDHPSDQRVLAPMVEREIIWRLLDGPLSETVRQIGLRDSSLTRISGVVGWIREHYDLPLRVEDLARRCDMSPSAFHRSFQAVTALSPLQFQKQIRLQKARVLLATSGAGVASAGYEVGYRNPSQFSREYRRQFGLSPGRDASRLRPVQAS
jgi:AraC-like DNA-binding protein